MLYVDEFERSAEAVREVKKGKIVIIDVTELDPNIARRVVDYISGAAEGLESKCQRVSGGIFCLAPAGTTFTLKRAPGTRQQSSVK